MTKKELIERLNAPGIKDDAIILVFDPDGDLIPARGLVIIAGEPGTIEICTDNPCE